MGREALISASFSWIEAGAPREGKALLESETLLFRGTPRVSLPTGELRAARVEGDDLVLEVVQGTARLRLGAAAPRWLALITSPPSLWDKLGVTSAAHVAVVGELEPPLFAELEARAASVRRGAPIDSTALVLAPVRTPAELARVVTLAPKLRGATALWVVYPKGKGSPVPEADVRAALREAGLSDNKTCRFDDARTALRFVVPKAAR